MISEFFDDSVAFQFTYASKKDDFKPTEVAERLKGILGRSFKEKEGEYTDDQPFLRFSESNSGIEVFVDNEDYIVFFKGEAQTNTKADANRKRLRETIENLLSKGGMAESFEAVIVNINGYYVPQLSTDNKKREALLSMARKLAPYRTDIQQLKDFSLEFTFSHPLGEKNLEYGISRNKVSGIVAIHAQSTISLNNEENLSLKEALQVVAELDFVKELENEYKTLQNLEG